MKYQWYYKAHKKKNEELCGDVVKISNFNDSFLAVLSDGLGSGVKANILANMTAEIITTMIKEGATLFETIETVTHTLPICKERGIAYSTFTVLQGFDDGHFRMFNFDNPAPIFVNSSSRINMSEKEIVVAEKKLKIWEGFLEEDDFIMIMSDGAVYAGLGELLNFGWGWNNINDYTRKMYDKYGKPKAIVDNISEITYNYYGGKPQDDTTILGILARERKEILIFTGPPLDPKYDDEVYEKFMSYEGKKIICGGTSGNIIARRLKREIEVDIRSSRKEIPPYGRLEGVDLVTEGVLTMSKAIEILKAAEFEEDNIIKDNNGAALLAKMIAEADRIEIILGQKMNPFYQNPDLPGNISIRKNIVEDLGRLISKYGKHVEIEYY